jgi:hypothetical protein
MSQISGVKKPLCHTNSFTGEKVPKYGVETPHEDDLGKVSFIHTVMICQQNFGYKRNRSCFKATIKQSVTTWCKPKTVWVKLTVFAVNSPTLIPLLCISLCVGERGEEVFLTAYSELLPECENLTLN